METWALANQKGGTGKTTTAINLAAALAARGKRVLLVDLDPQAHATLGLGVTVDDGRSSAAFFLDGTPLEETVLAVTGGFHLLPSEARLAEFEERAERALRPERVLAAALSGPSRGYDWVLIDCPPRADGVLCANALRAADTVCLVVETSAFALQGALRARHLLAELARDRVGGDSAETRREPEILVLATLFERTDGVSREFLLGMQHRFGRHVLDTVVRRDESLREAAASGVPARELDPGSRGALDHDALAAEILRRSMPRTHSFAAQVAACS